MTDFKLSICRLLEQAPLCRYRVPAGEGRYRLDVLLLGGGSRLEAILRTVLSSGQMLDTDLDVTVVSTGAWSMADKLLKSAPALGDHVRIFKDFRTVADPASPICTLRFERGAPEPEQMEEVLLERDECSYLIISTGNEARNLALAQACADAVPDRPMMIAYVQSRGGTRVAPRWERTSVRAFGGGVEEAYLARLENVARNLHWVYAKSQNERARPEQILAEFEDPYVQGSNLEAAVHVWGKLMNCGVETGDPAQAAAQFARLLEEQPELEERLAALEHRRWMLEKLLQGYTQDDSLSRVFSADGVTTHDSREKWHCCLVPCDETGRSRLTEQDWRTPVDQCRPELDPLDRLSLRLHARCGELARENHTFETQLLETIAKTVEEGGAYSPETAEICQRMLLAISQMWQQKRSALAIYQQERQRLLSRTEGVGILPRLLETLDSTLAPLKEFISFRDYKEQDRLMVRQIPFALTHRLQPTLIKIMGDRASEDLFSAWQLDPARVVLIGRAEDDIGLRQLLARAEHIVRFLGSPAPVFHIFGPETAGPGETAANCVVYQAARWTADMLERRLVEIMSPIAGGYLDVSGGDPLLTRAAEEAAETLGTAAFYVRNGRMRDLFGAPEVEYPAPVKGLTVREMFDLSGVVLESSESARISDLSTKYREIWALAWASDCWGQFCEAVYGAFKKNPAVVYQFGVRENPRAQELNITAQAAAQALPMLRQLEREDLIRDLRVEEAFGGRRSITYTDMMFSAERGDLTSKLQHYCDNLRPTSFFALDRSMGGQPRLLLRDLVVDRMEIPEEQRQSFVSLLKRLENAGVLVGYGMDHRSGAAHFQFASRDVLGCFQKYGTILEYLIYYSALLDGHFDDVEMGWKFQHSAEEGAASNEIDVVCTRGTVSLFISAKMGGLTNLNNNLNYVLYEILLLADHFGVNAKPILVAPAVHQFQEGGTEYSGAVKTALSRGVYLLGGECCRPEVLGQVLDRVADGNPDWCGFLRPQTGL